MSDRLVKYKQLIEKHRRGLAIYWIDTDKEITADVVFDWLISELEAARGAGSAKKACMKAALNQLKMRTQELKECKAKVARLQKILAVNAIPY